MKEEVMQQHVEGYRFIGTDEKDRKITELEKEAEEYALNTYEMCSYSDLPYASDRRAREQAYISGAEPREKRIAELEKENTKLKEESKKIFNDWLNACDKYGKVNLKFTKAKEVIKKFSEFANNEVDYDPEHPQEYTDLWHKLCEEAEQFLKENE